MTESHISLFASIISFAVSLIAIIQVGRHRTLSNKREDFNNRVRYVVDGLRHELEGLSDQAHYLSKQQDAISKSQRNELYTQFINLQRKISRRLHDICSLEIVKKDRWLDCETDDLDRCAEICERLIDEEDPRGSFANFSRISENLSFRLGTITNEESQRHI